MTRALLLALALGACGRTGLVDPAPADGGPASRTDGGPTGRACSEKISFDQASGCLNVGAVELCAVDDAATLAALSRLAPTIVPLGTPGRSGCQPPEAAYLWLLIPPDEYCVDFHGAMTDRGWDVTCALAAQPQVSRLAPFWAE